MPIDMTNLSSSPETICASHLDVGYGLHTVVRDISLMTAPGDLVALIGTNGSGKSTLLKTLAGILTPMHGTVSVLGGPPGRTPRRVAYLPQHPVSSHTLPLRARDVVAMGRYAHLGLFGRSTARDRSIVDNTMLRTGADGFAEKSLRELSGGQQQRTHLAQVLTRQAEVLLLDEPTAGLDIAGKSA
ncbi:MAG: metal ABC transporter ATP-binding protein, partial [Ilumatobacteraceae bacterium]